jgi:hypothetical protein
MIDSMGGYTSTNASCSDISGLCEIEDSEVNLSEEDSGDEHYIHCLLCCPGNQAKAVGQGNHNVPLHHYRPNHPRLTD